MTNIAAGRITLEDFILEMSRIPTRELKLGSLLELFVKIDFSNALIDEHVHFSGEAYTRNLVCRTPKFDMLVLCWKPGQVTTIHDHAGSLNVTGVYGGSLTSRMFEVYANPSPGRLLVRPKAEERLDRGAVACVDATEIHQLQNTSEGELVTVHVYAKPLKDMTVYCPTTGLVEKLALRYTLEDEFA